MPDANSVTLLSALFERSQYTQSLNTVQADDMLEPARVNTDMTQWLRLASFASLVNQKLVVLSNSSDYVALDWHFFTETLRPLIGRIRVDAEWYTKTYPDVKEAISKRIVNDAQGHYQRFGYFEHRIPYRIQVEEDWYLDQYPDVKEAIAKRLFPSGQAHFELNGYREGRIPYPNFELAVV
jgi:hypothetical protein